MHSKIFKITLFISSLLFVLNTSVTDASLPNVQNYKRVVVISDAHYPSKTNKFTHPQLWQQKINNKLQVVKDVNSWTDVNLIAVTGDLVALTGNNLERRQAKEYFAKYNKPLAIIAGNHEFTYKDKLNSKDRLVHATLQEKAAKLQDFKDTFELKDLYYTKHLGNYELFFLSCEPVSGKYSCELSDKQLNWLNKKLASHRSRPTIIFFHAPLIDTLAKDTPILKKGSLYAEPYQKLDQILSKNPQVKLWVSGHTHTPPTNPSFNTPQNKHLGILDIYNPTLDGKQVWTNSLYLYPDRIIVKTFDHQKRVFLDQFNRTVLINELAKSKTA